jgi:NitT/TauT family transport system permease protein
VASNVVADRPAPVDGPEVAAAAQRGARASAGRVAWAVLSPAVAATLALAVHLAMPNAQTPQRGWMDALPAGTRPYPAVLETLLAAAFFLAGVQWAWPRLRPWAVHYAPLSAGAVFALCVWDLITLKLNWLALPYFPGPNAVLGGMLEDRGILFESTWRSLLLLLTGYAVGVTAGLIVGVLIGWFAPARYWGMPILKVVGPMPATALVALAMTLFSQPFYSAAALIGYAVSFPVTMMTSSGISNVNIAYIDVARTLGAGRSYLIFRVAVPAALPNVFIGLFMGLLVSFLTLPVAETVGVQAGLGWYLIWQMGYVEYAKVYAAMLIMAVFFSTLMTLLFKLRDRLLKWQKGVIKW